MLGAWRLAGPRQSQNFLRDLAESEFPEAESGFIRKLGGFYSEAPRVLLAPAQEGWSAPEVLARWAQSGGQVA